MAAEEDKPLRSRPMEILVLGLCRTGTYSLKAALEKLGYKGVYHMSSVFSTPGHGAGWHELLQAKFGDNPRPITVQDFDRLLGDYSVVTDIPAVCLTPELLSAYPSALIILTTRSPSSWYNSMLQTIWASQTDPLRPFQLPFLNSHLKPIAHMMDYLFSSYFYGDFERYGKRVFEEHNERVVALAKAQGREVLVFEAREGWGPLCGFLGKEVPEGEYPRINDAEGWRKDFRTGEQWARVKRVGLGVLAAVPVVVAAGIALRRFRGKD